MMVTHKRRQLARGRWMKLLDPNILSAHMEHRDMNQARLARYAGCSRQFVNQLLNGTKSSCTPKLAEAIEEVLNVPHGALFVGKDSMSNGLQAPRNVATKKKMAS